MWNDISGAIPKEIGNITSLELLWVKVDLKFILLPRIFSQHMIGLPFLVINIQPWLIFYISLTETQQTDS